MNKLATRKRKKKNLSKFQKLWQRIERLKDEIEQRDQSLNKLADRIRSEIYPVEMAAISANVELLHRLLDLGQRKSWANWQRQEIERWIHENMQFAAVANLLDNHLKDAVARYDAFRLGVELDENDGRSPGEQLDEYFDEQRKAFEQHEAEQGNTEDAIKASIEEAIQETLRQELGARPADSKNSNLDMFEQDRDEALARRQASYDQEYAQLEKQLRKEAYKAFEGLFDEDGETDFDDVEFDDTDWGADLDPADNSLKLDNTTLQRLFRSTAHALHPDRELDPAKQPAKQKLMVQLLAARKSGDIMTLLSLYQQHVEHGEALDKSQEKELIGTLEKQVAQLEEQLEYYKPSSPFHESAFNFYSPSAKKIEKNIAEHLAFIDKQERGTRKTALNLRSMSKLKPLLEERYDRRRESEFMEHFGYEFS